MKPTIIPNTSTLQHLLEPASASDIDVDSIHSEAYHVPIIGWQLTADDTGDLVSAISLEGRVTSFMATDKTNVYGVKQGKLEVVAPYNKTS